MLSNITFLSAFLLFQIELIIAKLFLPVYGGSYLVWGSCVVFFQAVLLIGYIFTHYMIKQIGIKRYLPIHLGLMLVPFLFFPGKSIHIEPTQSALPLVIDVFLRLFLTIGPVFFILSTMSLVTQSWYQQSSLKDNQHPFRLYAISNIGSFLALFSYPFFIEHLLTNSQQLDTWRVLYVLLVILVVIAFKRISISTEMVKVETKDISQVSTKNPVIQWLLLGAGGVVMFLAVTNIISYEVAPIPLLWIIPLSIYLLGFVLTFKAKPWCPLWVKKHIALILSLAVAAFFLIKLTLFPPLLTVIILSVLLFFICLYAQSRLIDLKPQPHQLTLYYVYISLGGFLGGIITTWIIPLVSLNLVEYLFGILIIALTIPASNKRAPLALTISALLPLSVLYWWPLIFKEYSLLGLILLVVSLGISFFILQQRRIIFIVTLAVLLCASSSLESKWKGHSSVNKMRNYYGIYDIFDKGSDIRIMMHGTTLHGLQFIDPARRWIPLGYYGPTSPIGEMLGQNYFQAKTVAGIGLGAGTIAMYSTPQMSLDFYELDPDVLKLAQQDFSYLKLAPGKINVILGDARIALNQNPQNMYDIIVIDAFGGDSIPVHLINTDVIAKYRSHLNDQGTLLFHIPSRYFNLKPIVGRVAQETQAYCAYKESISDGFTMQTVWAVMTWNKERYDYLINQQNWKPLEELDSTIRPWSDNYSSVLPILKLDDLLNSLKHFNLLKW